MKYSQILIPLLLSLLAGLATLVGGFIALVLKKYEKKYLGFFLGFSAGVMIYVSFVELLADAITKVGLLKGNIAFFSGVIFIMLLDFFIPHEYLQEYSCRGITKSKEKKLMAAGVLTAFGIALHNFPEGAAVAFSSLSSVTLGISLALAIAIHNIPEGIAVAMPIYCASGSRKKAFLYALLSGISEPIGALIGLLILAPFLNAQILSLVLAFVAGVMVFISFDELLPLSLANQRRHVAVIGVFSGMLVMFLSLFLL